MKNRSHISRNLIGQFKVTVVYMITCTYMYSNSMQFERCSPLPIYHQSVINLHGDK